MSEKSSPLPATTGSSSLSSSAKRRKRSILKKEFYMNQFSTNEFKVLNDVLNEISEVYSEQKPFLTYEEAQYVCYYFFSVFELSQHDKKMLDREVIQAYNNGGQTRDSESIIDIILKFKTNNQAFSRRQLSLLSKQDITDLLSIDQILLMEQVWAKFDAAKKGFMKKEKAMDLIHALLKPLGFESSHAQYAEIIELANTWTEKRAYYFFFIEFSSFVAKIVNKFNSSRKTKGCSACTIF